MSSDFDSIDAEIHQMTAAIGDVAAPGAESIDPGAVAERAINFGINAPLADARGGNAGEIRFAGDARAETDVERVGPNIEFPCVWRGHCGEEINRPGICSIDA